MVNIKQMEQEPLTTGQVAEYCHVTYRAVLKWIDQGKLRAYRTPGQHSRVRVADFLEFLKKYNMPVPPELNKDLRKKKVLIVDDDKLVVDLIRRSLQTEFDFEYETAHDGFTAGKKFAEFRPDLVTLDINMPGLDGYQVCQQIRKDEDNKNAKILVVSGIVGQEEEAAKVRQMGADDSLPKPFEDKDLKKKVRRLLKIKDSKKEEKPGWEKSA